MFAHDAATAAATVRLIIVSNQKSQEIDNNDNNGRSISVVRAACRIRATTATATSTYENGDGMAVER